ncbi:MAG TPA: hypothetical protein PKO06_21835, partial [Candidatus Ozemobacteraceae bacterium]|nr:hypothetical protein [Candidatus Ozemobacteraceae bacterium]
MRKEDLQLLLITKIPTNEKTQNEILETFESVCESRRMDEYLVLLRAAYMNVPEIVTRRAFYVSLGEKLRKHLQQNPQLASGPTGLYLNFLAEDFQKTKESDLIKVGRELETAMRLAANPDLRPVEGRRLADLAAVPMTPEDAFREPQTWIDKLAACELLFKDEGIAPLLRELVAGNRKRARENANLLVLIGSHFEMASQPVWARACYRAAAGLDDTLELPWAFLAGLEPKLQDALACGNRAIRIHPRSLPGLRNRARVLARLNRPFEAFRDFAEVARCDSENPRALLDVAQSALDAGYALIAMRVYQFLSRRYPTL